MKKWTQTATGICTAALTIAAVVCVVGRLPTIQAKDAAFAAAGFIMPKGAAAVIQSDYLEEDEEDETTLSSKPSTDSAPTSSREAVESEWSSQTPSSTASSMASSTAASSDSGSASSTPTPVGGIQEVSMENTGTQYKNIWVKNTNKNHGIDVAAELAKQPAVKIKKNSTPQVLIYHTHTSEAFLGNERTQDQSKSVVAVGDQIEAQLNAAGIGVVHDKTYHDYPMYNGSYDRSRVTIQNNLKKYPGIQVTLDIHRDAIKLSDGKTRVKPTAVINGKKAAQIMVISGCDDDGTFNFPNWECNLRLAVRIQQSLTDMYPGLARPLNFGPVKYNENMTKGSLLIEIGTEVNTLDEAKYSGELLGKALAVALNKLT